MSAGDWPPPRRAIVQDSDLVSVLDRLRAGDRLIELGPEWYEFVREPRRVAPFRVRLLQQRGFISSTGKLTGVGTLLLEAYDALARGGGHE
jgi:hypothetical protein